MNSSSDCINRDYSLWTDVVHITELNGIIGASVVLLWCIQNRERNFVSLHSLSPHPRCVSPLWHRLRVVVCIPHILRVLYLTCHASSYESERVAVRSGAPFFASPRLTALGPHTLSKHRCVHNSCAHTHCSVCACAHNGVHGVACRIGSPAVPRARSKRQ